VVICPKISRKRFNENAKKVKRKQFITGAEARDRLAKDYGYTDFAAMERDMIQRGEWK